jgi:hypothetical protein
VTSSNITQSFELYSHKSNKAQMARTTFTILALALLCASAFAQDQPADKVSPAANAAAGAIGGALAPVGTALTFGIVPADAAAGRGITAELLHNCDGINHAL